MNKLKATISEIQSVDNLCIVSFVAQDTQMQMMSLGLNQNIKVDSSVILGVKSSNIFLAKNLSGMLSASNQLKCKIKSINNGKLLSSIKLEFGDEIIQSVITLSSSIKMNLLEGDEVVAIIKSSELSILEVKE